MLNANILRTLAHFSQRLFVPKKIFRSRRFNHCWLVQLRLLLLNDPCREETSLILRIDRSWFPLDSQLITVRVSYFFETQSPNRILSLSFSATQQQNQDVTEVRKMRTRQANPTTASLINSVIIVQSSREREKRARGASASSVGHMSDCCF